MYQQIHTGWLGETIGDNEVGSYYRNTYGMNKHVGSYGKGYLINWARSALRNARTMLLELPESVRNHNDVVNQNFAEKFINATINMLKNIQEYIMEEENINKEEKEK